MSTTAGDQIQRALRLLGVLAEGETSSAAVMQDSLNGVAWEDDSQVQRLVVEKSYGPEARTTVRIA